MADLPHLFFDVGTVSTWVARGRIEVRVAATVWYAV